MENFLNTLFVSTLFSSIIMLTVISIKTIFKSKLNLRIVSMLWLLVIIRLLVPFSIQSPVHIPNLFESDVEPEIVYENAEQPYHDPQQNYVPNNSIYQTLQNNNDPSYPQTPATIQESLNPPSNTIYSTIKSLSLYNWMFFVWIFGMLLFLEISFYQLIVFNNKVKKIKLSAIK